MNHNFLSASPVRFVKTFFFLTLFILLSSASFHAQNFERGKSSELKGLKKLYVNVGTDTERRNLIVNEIKSARIPGLTIVDSREEAEIVLRFGGGETEVLQDITTNPILGTDWTMTTVDRRMVRSGRGLIFIAGKDKTRPRIVMRFKSVQDVAFENRPAIKFAKEFVEAYKKANGLN